MRAFAALLLACQLAAHTVAVLDGELTVAADGGCALVLAIPAEGAAWLGGTAPRTRAEAAAWLERARPRLAAGVTLAVAGRAHAAGWIGTDAEVRGLPADDGALDGPLVVVLAWSLPAGSAPEPSISLFTGSTIMATCHLRVRSPDGSSATRMLPCGEPAPIEAPVAGTAEPPPPAAVATGSPDAAGFLVLGFLHIIPEGLDHILFVVGLWFGVRGWRRLLGEVTAFTAAHSLTLLLVVSGAVATGPVWARAVEVGIALSLAWIGVENLRRDPPRWRWLLVGAFGLLHGMGFAGALAEVRWPADGLAVAVLAANLGIELGQLAVLAACALLAGWWMARPWYRARVAVPASLAIAAAGLWWTVARLAG